MFKNLNPQNLSSLASCEGPWLKFESCPSCNKPEIHDEYNDYYYSNSKSNFYYDTTESPKIRPKRGAEECFCNFKTDGFLDAIQSKIFVKNKNLIFRR